MNIDPKKYGLVSEVAAITGIKRTTLDSAVARGESVLRLVETAGGTTLVSVASARELAKNPPRRGRPPKPR